MVVDRASDSTEAEKPIPENRVHRFLLKWYHELILFMLLAKLAAVLTGIDIARDRMDSIEKSVSSIESSAKTAADSIARVEKAHDKLEGWLFSQQKEIQSNTQRILKTEARLDLADNTSLKVQEPEVKKNE